MVAAPLGFASGLLEDFPHISTTDVKSDIPIFLISGRNLLDSPQGVNPFGNQRSTNPTPHLAIAKVAVGEGLSREHIINETLSSESGIRKTRFELKEINLFPTLPIDHFTLNHSECNNEDHPWISELRQQLDRSRQRTIAIYVHGFNTKLIPNTEFAAAMSHFGGREGAVVSYEWPSLGSISAYAADKGNAEYSTRVFRGVIANLAKETGADQVNIVAHSAGCPIVVNALKELRLTYKDLNPDQLNEKFRISRVALAAPDMDLMTFYNGVFDRFYEATGGVAVYASSADKALDFSANMFRAERLGTAVDDLKPWEKEAMLRAGKIEMIDVSVPEQNSRGWVGHTYYYRNTWVSSDLFSFLSGKSPEERMLVRQDGEIFWGFPENFPELRLNF
ncbi:MAG: alpha/beta hydrolase [Verrucomicrobiales bacterium]|nr:alpha/beta hydrolase [Verrucomicrobiales bacterium]